MCSSARRICWLAIILVNLSIKMKYVPPSDYTVIHGLYTPRACRIVFVIHRTVRILYGYGTVKPCVRAVAERQGLKRSPAISFCFLCCPLASPFPPLPPLYIYSLPRSTSPRLPYLGPRIPETDREVITVRTQTRPKWQK